MTPALDRRAFLGTAGAASAALALPALPAPRARAGTVRVSPKPVLAPFPLRDVTLLDGPFRANMARTCDYLVFIDADRLLHTFRLNVGLPSSAQPCGGWEAPNVQLRGHSTGHLLSALAQAHANTGDDAYAAKGRYIVAELARCQAASPSAGRIPAAVQASGGVSSQRCSRSQLRLTQSSATVDRSAGVDLDRPFTSRRATTITRVSTPALRYLGNSSWCSRMQSVQVRKPIS